LAHSHLGTALFFQGKLVEAIAAHREATRLQPDFAGFHNNLGTALRYQGKLDEAVAEHREAIRLKPDDALAHHNLGAALSAQGKLAEAIAEWREAARLQPNSAEDHAAVGFGLMETGDLPGALHWVRAALRIDPAHGYALMELSEVLLVSGRFAEAVPALERTVERIAAPGSRYSGYTATYKGLIPTDLVVRAAADDRPALAAWIYEVVLAVSEARAGDLKAGHRYHAACAAARAGSGRGKDNPPPDPAERAELRTLALGWLRADLAAQGRLLDADDPKMKASIAATLIHWKGDSDLAGVRDPDALSQLPEAERKPWQALWNDVDRVLQKASGPPP
jgi:tetratricopeptide (TPR) repeat protein